MNVKTKNCLFIKTALSIMLAISLLIFSSCPTFASDKPVMKFTCMSDLHLDDILIYGSHKNWDQFKDALKSSYGKGYSDLFLCAGDVSSYGKTSVWDEAKEAIEDAGYTKLLWALGNHAYGTTFENTNADDDFKKFIGSNSIYHHDVINGFHFICLGAEETDILVGDYVYSVAQENWVRAELEKAAEDSNGKPIFIISHYPLKRTRLADDLAKYDNVFFFWGHEHSEDWENYSINKYINADNRYTTSKVGATQYGYSNAADALLVDVYSDRVVLTVDRTDGTKLSPDSVTVNLTLPSWKAYYSNGNIIWYTPKREDVYVCVCTYYSSGQLISSEISKLDALMSNQYYPVSSTATNGSTQVFFVDSGYRPLGESTEFDFVVK